MNIILWTTNGDATDRMGDRDNRDGPPLPRGSGEVASALRTLKLNGAALLVSGRADHAVRAAMTRNLLGHPGEYRRRVLALTDVETAGTSQYLPGGRADGDTELFDFRSDVRAATARPTPSSGSPTRRSTAAIRAHLVDAIARARHEEALAPGELRVGVVSLGPLLDEEPLEDVRTFVRLVGSETRQENGLCHFHLPADDPELVEALMRSMDARIELRSTDADGGEHRFHLPTVGETTDWFPV
jgi:hypothetical protein